MTPSDDEIAAVLTDLALRRGRGKSFCPSEAAKALAATAPEGEWRPLMPRVRAVAAHHPHIEARQKGQAVDPVTARGPIRLALR